MSGRICRPKGWPSMFSKGPAEAGTTNWGHSRERLYFFAMSACPPLLRLRRADLPQDFTCRIGQAIGGGGVGCLADDSDDGLGVARPDVQPALRQVDPQAVREVEPTRREALFQRLVYVVQPLALQRGLA